MSLTLADSLVGLQDLSQITRQTLALVDGGMQWLDWAINDTLQRYSFPDETALVWAVQQGLHGTNLAYLPRSQAFINPVKMMTMGLDALKVIVQWEAGENGMSDASTIEALLAAHHVSTSMNLAAPIGILEQLGVGDSSLFANMGLLENLEMQQWSQGLALQNETDKRLAEEAAQFALKQARQPYDFMDYCHIYLTLAKREPAGSSQSIDQRMTSSESVLHALLPELFAYLDCPQTRKLPSPDEVVAVIKDWLVSGKSLGFTRLSSGARQIVATESFSTDPATMAGSVRSYVLGANQFFSRQQELASVMKQDGSTCCFSAEDHQHCGELLLNAEHVISLHSFATIPSTAMPEGQS
jgi:hypothetical protein